MGQIKIATIAETILRDAAFIIMLGSGVTAYL
jgi:hypothetical protein